MAQQASSQRPTARVGPRLIAALSLWTVKADMAGVRLPAAGPVVGLPTT
jgi:hypothetical protein